MNEKAKNMIHNLQQTATNGEAVATAAIADRFNFKKPRTLIAAGAVGLLSAAGLAWYLMRKNKK